MSEKGSILVVFLVLMGISALLGFGYYLSLVSSDNSNLANLTQIPTLTPTIKRQSIFSQISPIVSSPTPVPVKNLICDLEKKAILQTIDKFESEQQRKDAVLVLLYFTDPIQDADVNNYKYLTGFDQGNSPRLYNQRISNFRMLSYKVIEGPVLTTPTSSSCKVLVEEQRSFYSSSTTTEYLPPTPIPEIILMVKDRSDSTWKIDKYYPLNGVTSKYSGWGY